MSCIRRGRILFERAIAVAETALGPGHPSLAQMKGNLALMYDAQGRHAEAGALREQASAGGREPSR
jgi:Tetratricopeptide repeat